MSLTDRIIGTIMDPDSMPNKAARWVIVASVVLLTLMVAAKFIGGLW